MIDLGVILRDNPDLMAQGISLVGAFLIAGMMYHGCEFLKDHDKYLLRRSKELTEQEYNTN